TVDVRVIAATNRDLRAEVNAGRFRSDAFFRLAVLKVRLPSLRERPEDIPAIGERILRGLGASAEDIERLATPGSWPALARASGPGNVRELRNYLERGLVLAETAPVADDGVADVPAGLAYAEARRRALAAFERRYLETLVAEHGGRVAQAAQAAGM